MHEIKTVVDPYPKSHQHLKIVLNPDGTLEKVQIYSDAQGDSQAILAVYEELKEEIFKFGNRTTKIVAVHEAEQKREKKSWWKFGSND